VFYYFFLWRPLEDRHPAPEPLQGRLELSGAGNCRLRKPLEQLDLEPQQVLVEGQGRPDRRKLGAYVRPPGTGGIQEGGGRRHGGKGVRTAGPWPRPAL